MSYIKQHYHAQLESEQEDAMKISHAAFDMLTKEEYEAPGPEFKTLSKEEFEEKVKSGYFTDNIEF